MQVFDYTDDVVSWLNAPEPSRAFTEWILQVSSWLQLGFSGLGASPGDDKWEEFTARRLEAFSALKGPLLALLREGSWEQPVRWTVERAEDLVGTHVNQVDIAVLVGLGSRNASQGYCRERGQAFLWLEHFLEPGSNSGYLDLGVASIPIWLSHEIGHAVRYSTPATGSLVPQACANSDPWSFWNILDTLPLSERFLDEGLATEFSSAVTGAAEEQVLGMSRMEIQWLEENGGQLLQERMKRWDFTAWSPPKEWVHESLGLDSDRLQPPWTLERPPNRWGYFVGRKSFAWRSQGDWLQRLTQPCK